MTQNGHDRSGPSAVWKYLSEHAGEPPTPELLELIDGTEKVEAILSTGKLDRFSMDERYRIAWSIVRAEKGEASGH